MRTLIETDSRRRVSLAKLGIEADSYYLAEKGPDGSILLIPAEVRPKLLDAVDRILPGWEERLADNEPSSPSDTWERLRPKGDDAADAVDTADG